MHACATSEHPNVPVQGPPAAGSIHPWTKHSIPGLTAACLAVAPSRQIVKYSDTHARDRGDHPSVRRRRPPWLDLSLVYSACRPVHRTTDARTGMPQPLECLIIGRITTQSPVVVDAVRIAQELRVRRPHTPSGVRDRFACGDLPARPSTIAHAASRQPRRHGRVRRTNEVAERPIERHRRRPRCLQLDRRPGGASGLVRAREAVALHQLVRR